MTGHIAHLRWKSGVHAIEKLDWLRSTMAVNVLIGYDRLSNKILKYVVNLLAELLLIFSILL